MAEFSTTTVFADDAERREARELAGFLEGRLPGRRDVIGLDDAPDVSPEFAQLLARVLREVAEGHTVTVGSMPPALTTTVAAEHLGVSRTTLMKWIRSGELPSHKVGTHTRVQTDHVMALRRSRIEAQRRALEELIALEDRLDLE